VCPQNSAFKEEGSQDTRTHLEKKLRGRKESQWTTNVAVKLVRNAPVRTSSGVLHGGTGSSANNQGFRTPGGVKRQVQNGRIKGGKPYHWEPEAAAGGKEAEKLSPLLNSGSSRNQQDPARRDNIFSAKREEGDQREPLSRKVRQMSGVR